MTAEHRLDALIGALQEVEPALDDLTRARVGHELQAALRDDPPAPPASGVRASTSRRTRVLLVAGGAALAAAAAAAFVLVPDGARAPAPARRALAPGEIVDVVRGSAERVAIGGAEVTVYGPGRVSARVAAGASAAEPVTIIDADAAIVERAAGEGVWSLAYGDLDVRVTRAIFALDRSGAPRVTVMRGEVLLRCATSERTVSAGETGTCAPAPSPPAAIAPPTTPSPPPTSPVPDRPARRDVRVDPPPAAAAAAATVPAAPADTYAIADAAMRRGDRVAARAALAAVVAAHPDGREAAAALLDLARLAAGDDPAAARHHLDRLDAHPHAAVLAEPSAHLRCTLVPDAAAAARRDCLADYYGRFPDGPRAAAALARLAVLHATTDCAAAAPLLAEYVTRFPAGPDLAAVVAWRERCAARP